uniref:F-box protein AT5G49610-like beta-propeller domain-containing protein n=1 Tax=Leersia perrieri TaxID=77586 RepID=A0A0D9VF28_9ORYZ
MEGDKETCQSSTDAVSAAVILVVIGDNDLLGEILCLTSGTSRYVVVNPLHRAHDFILLQPRVPKLGGKGWLLNYQSYQERVFLSDDGASIILVVLQNAEGIVSARIYGLQSGEWGIPITIKIDLIGQSTQILNIFPPINGKLYIVVHSGCILALELATGHFFAIKFPGRVTDNLTLSHGYDSGLYLIHAKGLQLSIWHCRIINGDSANNWLLVNEARVCEACDHHDGVSLVGAADNAEFVFMRLIKSGALISMNLRTKVEKIYKGVVYGNVFPLMLVWPPKFPRIDEGNNIYKRMIFRCPHFIILFTF